MSNAAIQAVIARTRHHFALIEMPFNQVRSELFRAIPCRLTPLLDREVQSKRFPWV
jgi:hypothetical protein